jgi:uncharacterized protein (DUF433 family)
VFGILKQMQLLTQAEIIEDFSELTVEDIQACLAFAAN